MRTILLYWLMLPLALSAQTNFHIVFEFPYGNADGAGPNGCVVFSSNVLYGAAGSGGSNYNGVIFRVNADGTDFTNLYEFSAVSLPTETNVDGAIPFATLALSGNTLYGMCVGGGFYDKGTIFRINTDGTAFTNIHNFSAGSGGGEFTNLDGANPARGLLVTNNELYGVAPVGGTNGCGTLFRLDPDGGNFSVLETFADTNGCEPDGTPILAGGTLYGSTTIGGSNYNGCLYRINTNGSDYEDIFDFPVGAPNQAFQDTNAGGQNPQGQLVLIGDTLYGTCVTGGPDDDGTIFSFQTNYSIFKAVHSFSGADGAQPDSGLVYSGSVLYGAASIGGTAATNDNSGGTVFQINPDGSGFQVLHDFDDPEDGDSLYGGVILVDNVLYGTAYEGGPDVGRGTIYSITLPAAPVSTLNVQFVAPNIVLTWTNPALTLQSTTNLLLPFTDVPAAASPYTTPASGPAQFFRFATATNNPAD